jgi:hypothetical protein
MVLTVRHARWLCQAGLVVLFACGAPAAPEIAGTLHYSGGWTTIGPRTGSRPWLVYSFEARAGDEFTAHVESSAGAPEVRLADDQQKPLADGKISQPDGGKVAVAGATASKNGTYYVLVRDAADAAATFRVQLGVKLACHSDADCERAGNGTGDSNAPSPLDIVPHCLMTPGEAVGTCKGMTRESVEQSRKQGQ